MSAAISGAGAAVDLVLEAARTATENRLRSRALRPGQVAGGGLTVSTDDEGRLDGAQGDGCCRNDRGGMWMHEASWEIRAGRDQGGS